MIGVWVSDWVLRLRVSGLDVSTACKPLLQGSEKWAFGKQWMPFAMRNRWAIHQALRLTPSRDFRRWPTSSPMCRLDGARATRASLSGSRHVRAGAPGWEQGGYQPAHRSGLLPLLRPSDPNFSSVAICGRGIFLLQGSGNLAADGTRTMGGAFLRGQPLCARMGIPPAQLGLGVTVPESPPYSPLRWRIQARARSRSSGFSLPYSRGRRFESKIVSELVRGRCPYE